MKIFHNLEFLKLHNLFNNLHIRIFIMYRSDLINCINLELTEYEHAKPTVAKENSIVQKHNKTNEVVLNRKNLQVIHHMTIQYTLIAILEIRDLA